MGKRKCKGKGRGRTKGKKRKTVVKKAKNNSTDRISRLPNEVIHHILSFLPLKEAVATRLLSKTWCRISPVQHLNFTTECAIVYKLTNNMEETSHAETQDIDVKPFLDFVDQSLQGFCKQQESIRAFSLHIHFYCHKYDAPFINKWIKLTADNDFQVICIRFENGFYDPPRFILPHTIFTSKLLTVLSLVSCELKDYSLRDTARLDSLHDLSLEYIHLSDEIFNQLISFSPNIMHFSLKRCRGIKFLQLLNLRRLENVVIEYGCRFDSTNWIHRIKIEAQSLRTLSLRTFYFRRRYRNDSQLDLKCCKNLEILSLDAIILPRSFFENIFSDFPLLKSLFLKNQCKLEKIEFASPRLELLHLRHVGNLVDATIDTPNLRSFKYTNYDLLPFLFQMNTVHLQKTSFQLWPCTMDVSWFLKLREFIRTQSHNEVLSLKLLHNSKATFDLQELRGITIPPMRGVKHLKLKLEYDCRSWPSEALVDCILWSCHPEILTMELGGKQNMFIESLKFKLQCRKGVRNNCCKSTEIKCWRHDLKEVKIEEFIGTKKGMPLAQRKIISYRFKW